MMTQADFDSRYAAYEANLLNRYLDECDGDDYDSEEEAYWESLLEWVDAQG